MTGSVPPPAAPNVAEYTVGEIARAVKRTLEETFERVRVRGEISRPNYHSSGHLYLTLKDEEAVLDAVAWRGTVGRLGLRLEEGMEVICTGRVSSYPKSSRYQLVIDSVELAGEGALLKLLEDRRKRLLAEGLFDPGRKKKLPYLPGIIGVVTSPTGAVIRDILHRLNDRFPRHVLLWPVPVQGEGAAEKIAAAIAGFNALGPGGPAPRPDLIIVARGGGSLEDLWAFNEEAVVRAAAASDIPLISAVGHETDTTLIDFAADVRAPTPTAAAEMAVPVRSELRAQVLEDARRMVAAMARLGADRRMRLDGLARGLPRPPQLLEAAMQQLDGETERLALAKDRWFRERADRLAAARLRSPAQVIEHTARTLAQFGERLRQSAGGFLKREIALFGRLNAAGRIESAARRRVADAQARLDAVAGLLQSLSYRGVLERGFALVRDAGGRPLKRAAETATGAAVEIEFADGAVGATIDGTGGGRAGPPPRREPKAPPRGRGDPQGSLL
jgi:exodeoxyribonuclease VII large subunit